METVRSRVLTGVVNRLETLRFGFNLAPFDLGERYPVGGDQPTVWFPPPVLNIDIMEVISQVPTSSPEYIDIMEVISQVPTSSPEYIDIIEVISQVPTSSPEYIDNGGYKSGSHLQS